MMIKDPSLQHTCQGEVFTLDLHARGFLDEELLGNSKETLVLDRDCGPILPDNWEQTTFKYIRCNLHPESSISDS
jgi:hypothetical protein